MRQIYLLSFLLLLLFSCQKFEQNNPFDSKCPKELWTPSSFTAVQNGTSVTLSWSQPMNNISGFLFTKKVDSESPTNMSSQAKGTITFTDPTLIGGKLHTYTIVAYAGTNQSNIVTATVTPKLAAGGVTTTAPGTITAFTASSGGTITADGGSPLTARGICWGTASSPTITGSKTSDGTGIGTFTSTLSGLSANTTYFVRAYATNTVGTTYGNEVSFRTSTGISTISTSNITSISATTATGGGNITSDGGASVAARGVCWSTTTAPTIANNKTADGAGTGAFTSLITGLIAGIPYYVRSYATNSIVTTYGNEVIIKIPVSAVIFNSSLTYGSVSDVEGNTYKTIEIGTQKWMAENLKTTKYNDGTAIPLITDNTVWSKLTTPGYSWINNDGSTYKNVYGAIYNWYTVGTNRLCPIGWHSPSMAEWVTIREFLGGIAIAGGKMKESGTSHWTSPNTGATNSSGFTALPTNNDTSGWYWSSQSGTIIRLPYDVADLWIYSLGNDMGASVRCLADGITVPTVVTNSVASLTTTSAIVGGNVTSDGGLTLSASGVCWSTTTNPTIANSKTINGKGPGTFTSTLTGLNTNTTYYVRAYATNAVGTAYGTVSSITLFMNTPSTPITDIDGNVYKTVRIGDQTWMAENLKVTKYRNGNNIQNITDNLSWFGLTSGAYCNFFNDLNLGLTYGHLYNYFSVIDSRQLCPSGWHIPSKSEWSTLINYLGGESKAGDKLKEVGLIHWSTSPNNGDNSSGFTALPGGWRASDGVFYYSVGGMGWWWSSTEYDIKQPWVMVINGNNVVWRSDINPNAAMVIYDSYQNKPAGNSIRCIKD